MNRFLRFIRSVLFHIYIYTMSAILIVAYVPTIFMPVSVLRGGFRNWGRLTLWGLKTIVGLKVHIQGIEYIPRTGVLIASKHQSMMETSVLFCLLDKPCLVLKKELTTYFPFIGLLVRKVGLIVVDRKAGGRALEQMVKEAKQRVEEGYQVLIFPEGTRTAVGAAPAYKRGISALYQKMNVSCVPVALNTGLFWPRHSFWRYGGVCVFSFLKPIEIGLTKDVFLRRLSDVIEVKTDELIENAVIEW